MMMCFAFLGLLAQLQGPNPAGDSAFAGTLLLIQLFFMLLVLVPSIAGMWGVFVKAGEPGWASIVPVYNAIVLLRVAGLPLWYVVLLFIPCLSILLGIAAAFGLAKRFNVGVGFAVGLILLPFIFYPILGLGSAEFDDGRRRRKRRKIRRVREPEEEEEEEEELPRKPIRAKRRRVVDDDDVRDEEEETNEAPSPPPVKVGRRTSPPPPPPPSGGRVTCPGCGVVLRLPANIPPGKQIRCPKCRVAFTASD